MRCYKTSSIIALNHATIAAAASDPTNISKAFDAAFAQASLARYAAEQAALRDGLSFDEVEADRVFGDAQVEAHPAVASVSHDGTMWNASLNFGWSAPLGLGIVSAPTVQALAAALSRVERATTSA